MGKIILKFEGDHGNDACSEVEATYEVWTLLDQILWKIVGNVKVGEVEDVE